MRPSRKADMIRAAIRVAERDGITAVTMDAVAAEAGVTTRGLLYHWASREALLLGVAELIAQDMEDLFRAAAGKDAAEATLEERATAYMEVATTHPASGAELGFLLELPKLLKRPLPWDDVLARWAPPPPAADGTDPVGLGLYVARLAADGMWAAEALFGHRPSSSSRPNVAARILEIPATGTATSW